MAAGFSHTLKLQALSHQPHLLKQCSIDNNLIITHAIECLHGHLLQRCLSAAVQPIQLVPVLPGLVYLQLLEVLRAQTLLYFFDWNGGVDVASFARVASLLFAEELDKRLFSFFDGAEITLRHLLHLLLLIPLPQLCLLLEFLIELLSYFVGFDLVELGVVRVL